MPSNLKYLKKIIDKYEKTKLEQVTYNIFDVLGVHEREVCMCRMLADLLDPKGEHKKGTIYLELFLQKVLDGRYKFTQELLKNTRVIKEDLIPKTNKRIDIVIKNEEWFIPIEVKINADEQKSQCYSYYDHAKAKLVYLTKYGTYPSPYSRSGSKDEEWLEEDKLILISFEKHIVEWLKEIVKNETGELRSILNQYLKSIEEFTNTMDKELYDELAEEFSGDTEDLIYGLQIAEAVSVAKASVMDKVLSEIEDQIDEKLEKEWKKYNLKKEDKYFWYTHDKKANAAFYKVNTTFPGINYVVENVKLQEGLQLWFRVEVEHNLFAGFCVFDTKGNVNKGIENEGDENEGNEGNVNKDDENKSNEGNVIQDDKNKGGEKIIDINYKEELAKLLGIENNEIEIGKWWAYWAYLPNGKKFLEEEVPNFKEMNKSAIQLANETNREDFAIKCVDTIEKEIFSKINILIAKE